MSDVDESIDNEPSIRLQQIHHLKELVHNLEKVAIASENEDHVAGEILVEHKNISNYLDKMKQSAEERGHEIGHDLLSFLTNPDITIGDHWDYFWDKLKVLEGTSESFRRCCLFHTQPEDDSTIMHIICSKNPPVEVVKTLLDLIPYALETEDANPTQYNHLSINKREDMYPLQKVVQTGGSLEVVKLLVNADQKRETLSMVIRGETRGGIPITRSSVFHVLIANREVYPPEVFSEILRYLCCMCIGMEEPALLYQAESYNKMTPVLLFVQSLINREGLNGQEIMRNSDYIFLLKATCYSYKSKPDTESDQNNKMELHQIRQEIESITLAEAFLVCSPCFSKNIQDKVLNDLLSKDCHFLFEKDSLGQYPVHRIVHDFKKTWPCYFVNTVHRNPRFEPNVILEIVLKHAPRSAQLRNDEGRLPLHIVSDAQGKRLTDENRLDLLRIVWNAYPDAAEKLDGKTSLPPFALAVRGKDEETVKEYTQNANPDAIKFEKMFSGLGDMFDMDFSYTTSLSSSFFLLKQHPDILEEYIESGEDTDTLRHGAKRTKIENDNDGM